jgi:hypothetical protein
MTIVGILVAIALPFHIGFTERATQSTAQTQPAGLPKSADRKHHTTRRRLTGRRQGHLLFVRERRGRQHQQPRLLVSRITA